MLPSRGSDSAPRDHHPHRAAVVHPEVADVQARVVAPHRAGADQHRVGLGAHQVHLGAGARPGDPAALAGAGGDPAVERGGELQGQHRPPGRQPAEEAAVDRHRLGGEAADLDRDPGGAQRLDAARRLPAGPGPRSRRRRGRPRRPPAPRRRAGSRRCGRRARASRRPWRRGRASPASASATVSACGRPPAPVRPRPTTASPCTRMQPTVGFGQVCPSPRRASPSAARMKPASRSSAAMAFSRRRLPAGGGAQLRDEVLEVVRGLEVLVDAREAHVGDGVDPRQRLHDDRADRVGGDVGLAHRLEPAHDPRDHLVEPLALDRPLLHGDADRALELVAVERPRACPTS